MSELEEEIRAAINRHNAEAMSGTPDFILAEFLIECLTAFDTAVSKRSEWRLDTGIKTIVGEE